MTTTVETIFLTKCCEVSDTYWNDVHVCRNCHRENPDLIEVEGYAGVPRWEALPKSEIEAIRLAASISSGLI